MSETNDIFKMAMIFDQINHREISVILSMAFRQSYLLELLQIILLHSLENNPEIPTDRKKKIEKNYSDMYKLYMSDNTPEIYTSFYSVMITLEKIYRISIPAFYIFLYALTSQHQDFNEQLNQSIVSDNILLTNEELNRTDIIRSFRERFNIFYHVLEAIMVDKPNMSDEDRNYKNAIVNEYIHFKFNNFREINDDYDKVISVRDMMLETDPHNISDMLDDILSNMSYYRNKLGFLFRIESFRWSEMLDWMRMEQFMYERNDLVLNYFIIGIMNNTEVCIRLLEEFGGNFCNLEYVDRYGNTTLMYACKLYREIERENNDEDVDDNEPLINTSTDEETRNQFYNSLGTTNAQFDMDDELSEPPSAPQMGTRSLVSEPDMDDENDDELSEILPSNIPILRRYGGYYRNHINITNKTQKGGDEETENMLAIMILQYYTKDIETYSSELCNLGVKNLDGRTAYNYAVRMRMLPVVLEFDKINYKNTNMYDEAVTITANRNDIINDYIMQDEIKVNELAQYLNDNPNTVIFKFDNTYSIIYTDEIVNNVIIAKRYPCRWTSSEAFRPPENMIKREKTIFDIQKISGLPIGGAVLYNDIININSARTRYYTLVDTQETYESFVSSVLVDSADVENVVSMTHCNAGATGKIYRLKSANFNIAQVGQGIRKVKYLRKKKSYKQVSKRTSKRTSKRKSSKRRYKRN